MSIGWACSNCKQVCFRQCHTPCQRLGVSGSCSDGLRW